VEGGGDFGTRVTGGSERETKGLFNGSKRGIRIGTGKNQVSAQFAQVMCNGWLQNQRGKTKGVAGAPLGVGGPPGALKKMGGYGGLRGKRARAAFQRPTNKRVPYNSWRDLWAADGCGSDQKAGERNRREKVVPGHWGEKSEKENAGRNAEFTI